MTGHQRSPSKHVVSHQRWQAAQDWELEVWRREWKLGRRAKLRYLLAATGLGLRLPALRSLAGSGDDWNEWWKRKFEDYRDLPKTIHRAIELGCGPYTNIRLIKQDRRISKIVCSDPLAEEYVKLRGVWLAEAYRRGRVHIDVSPSENVPFQSNSFDLVVMINVLDHVRDMNACLSTAMRLAKFEGTLVLGQDLTDAQDLARIEDDPGHPISMSHRVLDEILLGSFKPTLHRILPREEGRNPAAHYGTYLLIGTKVSEKPA